MASTRIAKQWLFLPGSGRSMAVVERKGQLFFWFCLIFCVSVSFESPVRKEFTFEDELSTSHSLSADAEDEDLVWNDDLDLDDHNWISEWAKPSQSSWKSSPNSQTYDVAKEEELNDVKDDDEEEDEIDGEDLEDDEDEERYKLMDPDFDEDEVASDPSSEYFFIPSSEQSIDDNVKVRHTGRSSASQKLGDVSEEKISDQTLEEDGDRDNEETDEEQSMLQSASDDDNSFENDDDDDEKGDAEDDFFESPGAEESRSMFEDRVFLL